MAEQKPPIVVWLVRTLIVAGFLCLGVYLHGTWERTVIQRFAKLSYEDPNTWPRNQWLGLPTLQNPNDVWIIQEIISEVKPDYIIEAGTFSGGSAILWAMILRETNPNGKVITIDIEDKSAQARKMATFQQMVTFMLGSSTDPKIVAEIAEQAKGKKVLVILDSDHHKDHVLKEIESYAPLVSLGSYIIVQDSNINGHPVLANFGPGPMEAIEAFLASTRTFESDTERERLLFTMHPRGYLKRVK